MEEKPLIGVEEPFLDRDDLDALEQIKEELSKDTPPNRERRRKINLWKSFTEQKDD